MRKLQFTLLERLENRLFYSPDGCWLWTGHCGFNGYGIMVINRAPVYTHRLSYELYKDKITNGLHVLHKCDVRACVNPDHLYLGTQKDNVADAIRRHRMIAAKGVKSYRAKLSEENVLEIRALHEKGDLPKSLSVKFKLDQSAIRQIIKRQTWKHI